MRKKELIQILPDAQEVDAMWPYIGSQGGESTAVLLASGEVAAYENCSIWSLATVYAERAGRELHRLQAMTGRFFGDGKSCVLPIQLTMVLVALKYRRSDPGRRQTTMSYVNAAHACQVITSPDAPHYGAVRFASGYVLPLLWTVQTLQEKLGKGQRLQYQQAVYVRRELKRMESTALSIYEGGMRA